MTSAGPVTVAVLDVLVSTARTTRGARTAEHHDEDYEIHVEGEMPMVVRFEGGSITLADVGSVTPEPFSYSRIRLSDAGLRRLRDGSRSPTEAVEDGLIEVQSRLYGGGQFTLMLALAQGDGLLDHEAWPA